MAIGQGSPGCSVTAAHVAAQRGLHAIISDLRRFDPNIVLRTPQGSPVPLSICKQIMGKVKEMRGGRIRGSVAVVRWVAMNLLMANFCLKELQVVTQATVPHLI